MNDKWLICLKVGTKYSSDYVNILSNMTARNSSNVRFGCYTDDTSGIDKHIECFPLPNIPVNGWWYKPYFFSKNLPTSGTLLYCDLDVIIFNDLNKFFEYKPNEFCIIQDFHRWHRPNWPGVNSSVFRLESGTLAHVYDNLIQNPIPLTSKYRGDQDYLSKAIPSPTLWPTEWVMSYKWEMRQRAKIVNTVSGRNFESNGDPLVNPDTSIAVFHGEPNPHNCTDQWCKDNWK